MKKICLAVFAMATLLACDNPVSKKIKETKQNVSNTKEAFKELNTMQEDIKELQQVEPLTNEELKAWLPEEVNGMKRTGFKAGQGSYLQIAMIEGTYTSEDKSKKFRIEIMDGAGEVGATATAGMRILFSQDFEEEDEYKTRRTVTKDGMKAIEEYRKSNNRSTIQFFKDNRFYLNATGTNMDIEETWDAIEDLDIDDLGA
jgi:protein subunit release factor A